MHSISSLQLISQLCDLLHNPDFPTHLASALSTIRRQTKSSQTGGNEIGFADETSHAPLYLRIEASLCTGKPTAPEHGVLYLGCINLEDGKAIPLPPLTPAPTPDPEGVEEGARGGLEGQSIRNDSDLPISKRRKTVSGLRIVPTTATTTTNHIVPEDGDNRSPTSEETNVLHQSVRQVHSDTRFPQRKKPGQEFSAPVLEPTSTDKLIAGIWRQLHSPIQLSRVPSITEPSVNICTGVSVEVFHAVSTLCLKYYNQSQSSRALEMIVQAYWVECFEARIAVLRLENPTLSTTETRMRALKEACVALNWKEKDLRNRMAIWRGYKEIKDAGGWPSLIFASTGVYRFCKYRTGFGQGLSTRLRQVRSSLEVAADTLHPGWRDLLQVIKQSTPYAYHGHPHEWVTLAEGPAVSLSSTYEHVQSPNGFQYQFIDDCVLDATVFGADDPRRVPEIDPEICPVCKETQSDQVERNHCMCFPTLFGGVRNPVPVQVFRTASGKNNGVIARCNFDRGTLIGEFTGLITNGIEGVDVMVGGSRTRTYQIFQGQMGNFTRFINHSCRPNSQFQRFYWRGLERIILVSRGIAAGSEITVDYSDHYWRQLNKKCLCGEPCCRFDGRLD